MNNPVQIYLLTAKNCSKCIAMKALLRTAVVGENVTIKELDALSDEGIEIAIKYGADAVPSLIVNKKVLKITSKGCNVVEIRNAIHGK